MRRVYDAVPDRRMAIFGALAWAALMTASATLMLLARGFRSPETILAVLCVIAAGALIAFPLGEILARLLRRPGRRETAFAAAFISHAVMTIGVTSLLYSVVFWLMAMDDHSDFPSLRWTLEAGFTAAGALYQFAVLGTRLYMPVGLIALVTVSLIHLRAAR